MKKYTYRGIAAVVLAAVLALAVGPVRGQATDVTQSTCSGGMAGPFECAGIDLVAHLDIGALGGGVGTRVSDLWGWTDPDSGRKYALVGRSDGTAFVDITEPTDPAYLGVLPHSGSRESIWRDIKVYGNFAYIVADGAGPHGLQVFDLTQLRDVGAPRTFEAPRYDGFGSAHNVFVNEETGFAYVGGARAGDNPEGQACRGGLVMLHLADPLDPVFAGCFNHPGTGRAGTGYVHDVQCVVYRGPDPDYTGREICFGSNETAVSIADVTDKAAPRPIALGTYPAVQYVHQGWLSDDQRWFFVGDELDEISVGIPTRTLVFDVTDLDDPVVATQYMANRAGADHNMYVHGPWLFQANYVAGVVVLDISDPENPVEYGRFDTTPSEPTGFFQGAWSVYPFFDDGTVIASSIYEGLFVLASSDGSFVVAPDGHETLPEDVDIRPAYPNPFDAETRLAVRAKTDGAVRAEVVDVLGRVRRVVHDAPAQAGDTVAFTVDGSDLEPGTYFVRITGPGLAHTVSITRMR